MALFFSYGRYHHKVMKANGRKSLMEGDGGQGLVCERLSQKIPLATLFGPLHDNTYLFGPHSRKGCRPLS